MRVVLILVTALTLAAPLAAQPIFIEAESCTDHNWGGPAEFPGVVSGGKILRVWTGADPSADGYFARFAFDTQRPGRQCVWAAVSMPGMTSPFWSRIDGMPWHHFTEDAVGSLQDSPTMFGVSNCMAWFRLFAGTLDAGRHTLTIRVNERRSMLEKAYLLYLDAILITPTDVVPSGLVTPDTLGSLRPAVRLAPVPRAGKPGPPMLLGTSVMPHASNMLVKSLGFTLLQTDSEHLNVNQPAPGKWDWISADAGLAACRKAGVAWQYFPHFHWPPEWYRQSAAFVPSTGLRSGKKLPCMSLWSPDIARWFDSCYAAMAAHYGSGDSPVRAIYLGIHGDFGEATYPAGYHPDEARLYGPSGTAVPDFWCGDDHARADFRRMSLRKYVSEAGVRKAWGLDASTEDAFDYPPAAYGKPMDITSTPQSRRRWLDFIDWYYDSMTRFTASVAGIARKHFPKSLLVVPLGNGDENLLWGQDNTAIPRAMRASDTQIRSTHGGYQPFAASMATMEKRLATAAKLYRLPFWTEPPGGITPDAEVSRFMEEVSCGSWGYWDWGSNPVGAARVFRAYRAYLTREKPVVDVAMLFPTTSHRLDPAVGYPPRLQEVGTALRDVMDFDIVDEQLIGDGALASYRVLIVPECPWIESAALARIMAWVRQGGVVVRIAAEGMETVENAPGDGGFAPVHVGEPSPLTVRNPAFLKHLRGLPKAVGAPALEAGASRILPLAASGGRPVAWAVREKKGWILSWSSYGKTPEEHRAFYGFCCDAVYNLSSLDPSKRNAVEVDKFWDGVYCTLFANGEVFVLNEKAVPKTVTVGRTKLTLPPHSLRSVLWQGTH